MLDHNLVDGTPVDDDRNERDDGHVWLFAPMINANFKPNPNPNPNPNLNPYPTPNQIPNYYMQKIIHVTLCFWRYRCRSNNRRRICRITNDGNDNIHFIDNPSASVLYQLKMKSLVTLVQKSNL